VRSDQLAQQFQPFAPVLLTTKVTPVTCRQDGLKLETRPRPTGSAPVAKMIGMVAVAALAATAAGGASAMIATTGRPPDRRPMPAIGRSEIGRAIFDCDIAASIWPAS